MDSALEILVFGVILYFVVIIAFHLAIKTVDGEDDVIDLLIDEFKILKNKCYGYFRKRFCKKSPEINAGGGTIQYDGKIFDSSSNWED
jgi:hypothetical protein